MRAVEVNDCIMARHIVLPNWATASSFHAILFIIYYERERLLNSEVQLMSNVHQTFDISSKTGKTINFNLENHTT